MDTRYARAYVAFSNKPQGRRLIWHHARVKNSGRDYEYVALSFYVPGVPVNVATVDRLTQTDEPYTRPRTLRKRGVVVREARAVAERLGWTMTPAELQLLDRMSTDRTRETADD